MVSLLDSLKGIKIETPTGYVHKGAFSKERNAIVLPEEKPIKVKAEPEPKGVKPMGGKREGSGRPGSLICPTCKTEPRPFAANGKRKAYCLKCQQERTKIATRKYEDKRIALGLRRPRGIIGPPRKAPVGICTSCLTAPRVYPLSGSHTYCKDCCKVKRREKRERDKEITRQYLERRDVTQRVRTKGIPGTDY